MTPLGWLDRKTSTQTNKQTKQLRFLLDLVIFGGFLKGGGHKFYGFACYCDETRLTARGKHPRHWQSELKKTTDWTTEDPKKHKPGIKSLIKGLGRYRCRVRCLRPWNVSERMRNGSGYPVGERRENCQNLSAPILTSYFAVIYIKYFFSFLRATFEFRIPSWIMEVFVLLRHLYYF